MNLLGNQLRLVFAFLEPHVPQPTSHSDILERVVGLEVRVEHVEREVDSVIDRLDAIDGTVTHISTAVTEIRGYSKGAWLVLQGLAWLIGAMIALAGLYAALK